MPRTNVVGTTAPPGSGAQRCAQAGEREHRTDSTAGTASCAKATVDALMFSLRRGINELTQPGTLRRLSTLDQGQVKDVCRRVQVFKPEIATPWSPEEAAAIEKILGRSK
jgi:hypothetical protein